jgi:Fic family protein
MILNHKDAISYIVRSSPALSITSHTIRTIHYLLSDGLINKDDVGRIRRAAVRIGGSNYTPYSNPHKLEELLDLITAKARAILDPFEQSFFLLIHLSYLQPFIDVNKRTSRLSCNIPLIQRNFVPFAFIDVDPKDYTSSILAVYELQNPTPMIDLYVHSYLRTCPAYDTTYESMAIDLELLKPSTAPVPRTR